MIAKTLRVGGQTFELTAAEQYFLEQCRKGEWAEFGGGALPQSPQVSLAIRAELVRFAMLEENDSFPIHWRGPRLKGAWITGQIGLELCRSDFALKAINCFFDEKIHVFDAQIYGIELDGSHCPGISAHRLRTTGPVLMENGFHSTGEIDLDYSRIDGRLGLEGATLEPNAREWALTAAGVRIRDGISFSNLKIPDEHTSGYSLVKFVAKGPIRLRSTRVGGHFRISGGQFAEAYLRGKIRPALDADGLFVRGDVRLNEKSNFNGNICLRSATIHGQVEVGEIAVDGVVDLNSSIIKQKLVLNPHKQSKQKPVEKLETKINAIDLRLATVGVLKDNDATWNVIDKLYLSDFTYDDIESDVAWGTRMETMILRNESAELISKEEGKDYGLEAIREISPQPFTFWARQLDAQGHRLQASWVRYEREKLLRRAHYAEARKRVNDPDYLTKDILAAQRVAWWWYLLKSELRRLLDGGFGFFFGYGHKPGRAVLTVFGIWIFSVALYGMAYDYGQMAPNSDVILTSKEWQNAITDDRACPLKPDAVYAASIGNCIPPLQIWTGEIGNPALPPSTAAQDYENFNRYLYALDLFVPLDSLGQELAWVPARDRGVLGWWAYSLRWLIQMAGWIFTAVGAATITGLLARKE